MDDTTGATAIGSDPAALEAYREHLPAVRMFVARRVDDPHTAADLTVDVFLAAIDAAEGYRPQLGAPASSDRIAERLDSQRGARRIHRSLAQLPEGQRSVVELASATTAPARASRPSSVR